MFATYDDPESLALKCKYVLAHRLRGVMFWDYENDAAGALLSAVNDGLMKSAASRGESQ
jgi:chitinase